MNFDLRDIVPIIGDTTKQSKWLCYDSRFPTVRGGQFNEFRDEPLNLSGLELAQLAS